MIAQWVVGPARGRAREGARARADAATKQRNLLRRRAYPLWFMSCGPRGGCKIICQKNSAGARPQLCTACTFWVSGYSQKGFNNRRVTRGASPTSYGCQLHSLPAPLVRRGADTQRKTGARRAPGFGAAAAASPRSLSRGEGRRGDKSSPLLASGDRTRLPAKEGGEQRGGRARMLTNRHVCPRLPLPPCLNADRTRRRRPPPPRAAAWP